MENKEKQEDNSKEEQEEQKQEKAEEQKPQETNANPQPSENGVLNEVVTKMASLKQELIDYIDLKFNNVPIAKVEPKEDDTIKKELPKW